MANTGFKIQGADLGDVYLTYTDLAQYYPTIAAPIKQQVIVNVPVNPAANTQVAVERIFGGWREGAYINTDGTLWMWGSNTFGDIGDGTTTSSSYPVQVVGSGKWVSVCPGRNHVLGIKQDTTLWAWGSNGSYVLGSSNFAFKSSSPVQVVATSGWRAISSSTTGAAAIKTDNTLWTWGNGNYGSLGSNATTNLSQPTQIFGGGTNWKVVLMRQYGGAAIKTDGTLWSWGYNGNGELGDNTTVNKSSPVQTVAGGTNWKQIVCSAEATVGGSMLAVKTDGTLWRWGRGLNQLTSFGSSPVQILANNKWTDVYGSGAWLGFSYARDMTGNITRWYNGNEGGGLDLLTTVSPPNESKWMQFVASGTSYIGAYDQSLGI